jgi:hypothetical protein
VQLEDPGHLHPEIGRQLLLQHQARPHHPGAGPTAAEELQRYWGTPQAPYCRGFTPEEFQALDFSKMDLSEYYADVTSKAQSDIQIDMKDKIDAYQQTSCHRSAALAAALLLPSRHPRPRRRRKGLARGAIEAEGQQAADRLRAPSRRSRRHLLFPKGQFSQLPDAPQRRAFDGLHRRFTSPAMDTRARAAAAVAHADLEAQRAAMAKRIGQALGLEAPAREALAGVAAPSADKASCRSSSPLPPCPWRNCAPMRPSSNRSAA